MKKPVLFLFILLTVSSIVLVGCGVSKLVSQVGDAMAKAEDRDTGISAQIAGEKSWSVYEVWANENIYSGFFSRVPNRSASTRIIVSPFYENNNDPAGKNNSQTFERWIKEMQDDNHDIYYLAKRIIVKGVNYDEAYKMYKETFLKTQSECEDIFKDVMINKEQVVKVSKMEEPLGVYLDGDADYEFTPGIPVISQSKRNLEITGGILRLPGDHAEIVVEEIKKPAEEENVQSTVTESKADSLKNEIAPVKNSPAAEENKSEVVKQVTAAEINKPGWIINWPEHSSISTKFQPDNYPVLTNIVDTLLRNPDLQLEIGCYTDNIGAAVYNKTLSEKRADVIKNYLVNKGIAESRLKPVGYGEDYQPAEQTEKQAGIKSNRVEFKIFSAAEELNNPEINSAAITQPVTKNEEETVTANKNDEEKKQDVNEPKDNPVNVAGTKPVIAKKKFITNDDIIDKVYAGINLSSYAGYDAIEMNYKPTFSLGVSKSLFYLGNLEAVVEVGYSLKGAKQTYDFLKGNPNFNEGGRELTSVYPPNVTTTLVNLNIHSVQAGFILKYNIPVSETVIPNIFAGFVANGQIGVGNYIIQKFTTSEVPYYSAVKAEDCSLTSREVTAGIGIDFAKIIGGSYRFKVFGVELAYTRGLNTIYKDDTVDTDTWYVNGITKKETKTLVNSQISLRVHWGFLFPTKY